MLGRVAGSRAGAAVVAAAHCPSCSTVRLLCLQRRQSGRFPLWRGTKIIRAPIWLGPGGATRVAFAAPGLRATPLALIPCIQSLAPVHRAATVLAPRLRGCRVLPRLRRVAGSRRLAAGSAGPGTGAAGLTPRDIADVALGVTLLFGLERGLAAALHSAGWGQCPASVAGILTLGSVCAGSPAIGATLYRVLGPASVWMKTALPLLLVPPIAAPLTSELPASILGAVAVGGVGLVLTMVLTGRLATLGAKAFAGSAATELSAALSPAMQRHTAAAVAMLRSPRLAWGALGLGGATTALLWATDGGNGGGRGIDECWIAAPGFIGITTWMYVASAGLPKSIGRYLPPTVCSGLGMVGLLTAIGFARDGGMEAVRREAARYMDGGGRVLMTPVPPALITLGLMSHTHRQLLRQRLGPVILATAICAPVAFIGTAVVGSRLLRVGPEEVASMIPGTTTTGLALTMHGPAHPLARPEWLALGPTVCGLSGMVVWPAILAAGGLAAAPPWVKGFAVGSASHVAGMAALAAAGEAAAAEWAALAFFLFGTFRCVLLQLPPYREVVGWACTAEEAGGEGSGRIAGKNA